MWISVRSICNIAFTDTAPPSSSVYVRAACLIWEHCQEEQMAVVPHISMSLWLDNKADNHGHLQSCTGISVTVAG